MQAIILAAGKGSRLGKETDAKPKCLVTVDDKSILDHQLALFESVGIQDIIIVVGFKKEIIRQHLALYDHLNFTFIENNHFEQTNTAFSLNLALKNCRDDFILINGDVVCDQAVLERLMHSPHDNCLAIERKITGDEEVKVSLENTRISAIGKQLEPEQSYGEFIGAAKFSQQAVSFFTQSLEEICSSEDGKMAYFEAGLEKMLSIVHLTAVDITDLPSIEIDFPEDLTRAREKTVPEIMHNTLVKAPGPKVLFYAERNLHLPFLEPIHDYMQQNCGVITGFASPAYRKSANGVTGCGLDDITINRLKQKSSFYHQPEDMQADITVIADSCYYAVRNCGKIVNIGHGLISKGWFYTDSPPVRRENQADLICVPGQWHADILKKNVFSPCCVTGFIKTDAFFNVSDDDLQVFFDAYTIPASNRIVLFAPTFNPELSSVPCISERIKEISSSNTTVIIKLHGMTDKKWVDLYTRLANENKYITLIDDKYYPHAMKCAHVMVSDVSSAFVEFLLLDKPVVLFQNPNRHKFENYSKDSIEYQLMDAAIEVATVEELKLAVKLCLADPAELSSKRRCYAEKLNVRIDGKCSERASKAIMDLHNSKIVRSRESVLYSIIVFWQYAPNIHQIDASLRQIMLKNCNSRSEIIFVGPKPQHISKPPSVSHWLDADKTAALDIKRSVKKCSGDLLVFMLPAQHMPFNWLSGMYNYFRWDQTTGAVKTFTSDDNYRELINHIPANSGTAELKDVAEYFKYVLIGNDISTQKFDGNINCLMMTREAFCYAEKQINGKQFSNALESLSISLEHSLYLQKIAFEIFTYPSDHSCSKQKKSPTDSAHAQMDQDNYNNFPEKTATLKPLSHDENAVISDTHELPSQLAVLTEQLSKAIAKKKQKKYAEAITELETAKNIYSQEINDVRDTDNDVLPLLEKARRYKKQKDYGLAVEILETAKMHVG